MKPTTKQNEENKRNRMLSDAEREALALGMIRYAMEQQPKEQRRDTIAGCLRAAAQHAEIARSAVAGN